MLARVWRGFSGQQDGSAFFWNKRAGRTSHRSYEDEVAPPTLRILRQRPGPEFRGPALAHARRGMCSTNGSVPAPSTSGLSFYPGNEVTHRDPGQACVAADAGPWPVNPWGPVLACDALAGKINGPASSLFARRAADRPRSSSLLVPLPGGCPVPSAPDGLALKSDVGIHSVRGARTGRRDQSAAGNFRRFRLELKVSPVVE